MSPEFFCDWQIAIAYLIFLQIFYPVEGRAQKCWKRCMYLVLVLVGSCHLSLKVLVLSGLFLLLYHKWTCTVRWRLGPGTLRVMPQHSNVTGLHYLGSWRWSSSGLSARAWTGPWAAAVLSLAAAAHSSVFQLCTLLPIETCTNQCRGHLQDTVPLKGLAFQGPLKGC